MKLRNPMQKLFGERKIIDDERVRSLVEKQKIGQGLLEKRLFDFAEQFRSKGMGAVVVGHTRAIPDLVLVDWEKRQIIAFEYEKMMKGVRKGKYDSYPQYDDVIWHVEQRVDDHEIYGGFACLPVKNISIVEQESSIYNLEVEEDNSFVCQNIVVHNCLHSEINALIKADSSVLDKKMYVTVSPCPYCAIAIVNANVSEVIYGELYRSPQGGLNTLDLAKIPHRLLA